MNEVPESYLMELAKQKWPWNVTCGFIHTMDNVKEYDIKKRRLQSLVRTVSTSPYTDSMGEWEEIPEHRLKERVIEVFHANLGPKNMHCIAKVQISIKKTRGEHRYAYYFCNHHDGHCPHSNKRMRLIRQNG